MTRLWLGLDVGTTAAKAAAYMPDGRQVAMAEASSAVTQRRDGSSEQDMEQVRKTVFCVLAELVKKCDGHEFEALGVAAQGDGLWCVADDGKAAGPAILWNDTRTASDLAKLEKSGATKVIGRGCHTSLWSGTSGILWRWTREHRPEVAKNTAHVVTCADWVGLCLTGRIATDFSNSSIPFLDFEARAYASEQLAALECEDLARKLVEPSKASSSLGGITRQTSESTGLPAGLPVSVGTLDLSAMIVGMGMDRPGQTMMIMGTTAVVNILTDRVEPTDTPVGASVLHPTSDAIIRVLAPTTGAAAFDWFASLHPKSIRAASASETAERMTELVREVPPGANGVTFLPYLNGERAPFVAPDIRGAFHGLSATTTTGEMGRAVMEGAALSLRHCFEAEGCLPSSPVQLTGGGARNPVWCQIIADVVGQPVLVSSAADHGLWGAAALGASVAGHGDAVELASRRNEALDAYEPKENERYHAVFERYSIISSHQRRLQSELASTPSKSLP